MLDVALRLQRSTKKTERRHGLAYLPLSLRFLSSDGEDRLQPLNCPVRPSMAIGGPHAWIPFREGSNDVES